MASLSMRVVKGLQDGAREGRKYGERERERKTKVMMRVRQNKGEGEKEGNVEA